MGFDGKKRLSVSEGRKIKVPKERNGRSALGNGVSESYEMREDGKGREQERNFKNSAVRETEKGEYICHQALRRRIRG